MADAPGAGGPAGPAQVVATREAPDTGATGAGAAPATTVLPLRDIPGRWPVTSSAELPGTRFLHVRRDTVVMPGGGQADREIIDHPGAVAIAALDARDRVLMIRQYRHAPGGLLWEIPAGLRDVAGEPLVQAAQRELLEETGHRAADWHVLTDVVSAPGFSSERVRIFLARGVSEVPAAEQHYVRTDEEASLQVAWVPLDAAVRGFLAGDLHNGVTGVGILSAYAAITSGFGALRETGAPETL
jgi:8-oxo-dGTP pyrophosphatase MutT (NUDIX family)